ncbi:hypothetical protein C8F01DRAFT_1237010 [Mycena amicta]|nr:hypothetical protein C8F01DRAFT_1237010 [Mycena amicta]
MAATMALAFYYALCAFVALRPYITSALPTPAAAVDLSGSLVTSGSGSIATLDVATPSTTSSPTPVLHMLMRRGLAPTTVAGIVFLSILFAAVQVALFCLWNRRRTGLGYHDGRQTASRNLKATKSKSKWQLPMASTTYRDVGAQIPTRTLAVALVLPPTVPGSPVLHDPGVHERTGTAPTSPPRRPHRARNPSTRSRVPLMEMSM